MKIVIACGGTGGHLFPGLAVAETLLQRSGQVRILVSEKAVDRTALQHWPNPPESTRFESVTIGAVGSSSWRQWMRFCSRQVRAVRECAALYATFQPDVVLGMGGFVSAPAVMAARARGIATVIHESNAVPGKANRWAARFADHIAVGLAECAAAFAGRPVTVTGTPVRVRLRHRRPRAQARTRLGLAPERQTVLVIGGSQGARALNEGVVCLLPWLADWRTRLQFVHVTGAADAAAVRAGYAQNQFPAAVMEFCHEMELAYSAADLVVARAGAASLAELAVFGLPAVLVPLPTAADHHQERNAAAFVRAGAARVVAQPDFSTGLHATRGERLAETMRALLADEPARARMAAAARALARVDAAERVVAVLEQACGRPLRQTRARADHARRMPVAAARACEAIAE